MSGRNEGKPADGERVLTVIPDANVLIHGKALPDLFWAELDRRTIEILFVAPAIRELDKLKIQSGRPNKIARQLSSEVRELLRSPNHCAKVRESAPAVTKRVEVQPINQSLHPALKLDHPDQALINYALHLRDDGLDVLLLTDDTICSTTAHEVGLPTLLLPEHWLRDPEPDEVSKENAKLKAEIKRLTAAEPNVVFSFHNDAGEPVAKLEASIRQWPALNEHEIDALMSEVRHCCPPATSFEQPPAPSTDPGLAAATKLVTMYRTAFEVYEPATEGEIERYKTTTYPNWLDSIRATLSSLHKTLQARTPWPTVRAIASNTGAQPAANALLWIRARGTFIMLNTEAGSDDTGDEDANRKAPTPEHLGLPFPPTPPRGSVKTSDHYSLFRSLGGPHYGPAFTPNPPRLGKPPPPRRSDAFYWRTGQRGWVDLMELECASWRHRHEDVVVLLKVRPDQATDVSGAIELSMHAQNISDPSLTRLPIRISYEGGSTIEEARALVEQLWKAAHAAGRL